MITACRKQFAQGVRRFIAARGTRKFIELRGHGFNAPGGVEQHGNILAKRAVGGQLREDFPAITGGDPDEVIRFMGDTSGEALGRLDAGGVCDQIRVHYYGKRFRRAPIAGLA